MTDSAHSARSDLAFMKAVADDRGPLPRTIGEHMLVPGVIFGLNFVLIWAINVGLVPWPSNAQAFLWAPGAVLYLACYPFLMQRAKGAAIGPGARAFAGAWIGVAVMTFASVAMIAVATLATGKPYFEIWPASAFVLYGGAWAALAVVRWNRGWAGVALGCFAIAIAAAAVLLKPEVWLIMAAGLFLFVAGPGLVIIRRAVR